MAKAVSGTADSQDVDEIDIFDILSHPRRRFLVHALKSNEDRADIGDLAEQIAAWELEIDRTEVSSQQRKRLYTSIQQQHLPRMEEAGYVVFDSDRGVVQPTEDLEQADIYLETVTGHEIAWSEFYLGLSGVFAALAAVVWLGIWPFKAVPTTVWLMVVVATVAVSAMGHRHQNMLMKLGRGDTPPELVRADRD